MRSLLERSKAETAASAERAGIIARFERQFSAHAIRKRRLGRGLAAFWMLSVRSLEAAKRLFDVAVSGSLLVVLAPLLLTLHRRNRKNGGALLRTPKLGRWGCTFNAYSFSSPPLQALPALINVWKGDMSFIGPRPLAPEEVPASNRLIWRRFSARPGLFCLWWIRLRANIAYGSEVSADAEYVDTQSLSGDLGIALRAIPAFLFGQGAALAPDRINLLGIPVDNLTMEEAIEAILRKATGAEPSQVCFVNADCLNIACRDADYRRILQGCGFVLADGIGVRLAGKILNRNIKQNVNGTDMLPPLCQALEKEQLKVYLLGGAPGVAAEVASWMRRRFPSLPLCGHRHGYFSPQELPEVLAGIRTAGAQVVMVALGAPRQEKWIRDHLRETGATLGIGVGGLFDFYSGRIPRAPTWVRELGMEWFYRFAQEPRRMWRRYFLGNLVFMARIVRDRSRNSRVL